MTEQELVVREIVEESTASLYTRQLELEVEIIKLKETITKLSNMQNPQQQQSESVDTEEYFTRSH